MKRQCFTIVIALMAMPTLILESASAENHFFSRSRTLTKRCLPNYDYAHNVWPFTTPRGPRATVIAVAATDPTDVGKQVKPFHFRANSLTVGNVTLDDVGISLYNNDGKLYASGRLSNNGGDGGVIGNHVVIHLRAYISHTAAAAPDVPVTPTLITAVAADTAAAENLERPIATPNSVTRIPPDAYVVWQTQRKFWVSRGEPETVSMVKPVLSLDDWQALTRHFKDITHIELELQQQRDR
jgi:hypothetical protein